MVVEYQNLTISSSGTLATLQSVPFLALKEKILGKAYDLSIAFVTPQQAAVLNRLHRGKEYVPNTLSFALTQSSGEIILCRSELRAQCKKFGMTYETFVTYILIHSMLHLIGMQHGSTMERKEKRLLAFFTASA